jgi:hypothetical protein
MISDKLGYLGYSEQVFKSQIKKLILNSLRLG